jgi:hypothetical protein
VEKPADNFIILETLSSGNQREELTKQKVFFILNTENKSQLQIGRNATCDVRIGDDISVSRIHSNIRKIGEHYYIEDNDSTFGTLVQLQYPLFISSEMFSRQPIVLQSGKTQMIISCKVNSSSIKKNECLQCFNYCVKTVPKKSNKGLVSFDKKSFFPVHFMEQIHEK